MVAIALPLYFFHTMEVNGYRPLFLNQLSSEYIILCSSEELIHSGLERHEGE